MGISGILQLIRTLGNFRWEILHNRFADSPFLTSDFPAAIEKTADARVLNRIVPLSPTVALRIHPDIMLDTKTLDFSFANFRFGRRYISRQEIAKINTLIVRCAEDMVFYTADLPWIKPFITKNRGYRIEPHTQVFKLPKRGALMYSTLSIAAK